MDLQEFIKGVLTSIDRAIDAARTEMNREVSLTNTQSQRTVEFDIAVTVEESGSQKGKAGIRVMQFADGSGEISKESKNSSVSRIQFGVYISPSTKSEEARQRASLQRSYHVD